MATERFFAGLEIRADGRSLVGPAIRYGEVSPGHRERFDPGAFALDDGRTRWLDVGHDRQVVIAHTDGGGLEFRDTPEALEVTARLPEIPAAMRALDDVKAGRLRGFSVEFDALQETRDGEIRVVERAALAGVGLVRNPSYAGSVAEVRQGAAEAFIPFNRKVDCECATDGDCEVAMITEVELQNEVNLLRDLIAVSGNYRRPLASLKRGTLAVTRGSMDIDGEAVRGLSVAITPEALAATEAGRALEAAGIVVPIYARPIVDVANSSYQAVDGVAMYDRMRVKGFTFGTTDKSAGWMEVQFGGGRRIFDEERPIDTPTRTRRRWQ